MGPLGSILLGMAQASLKRLPAVLEVLLSGQKAPLASTVAPPPRDTRSPAEKLRDWMGESLVRKKLQEKAQTENLTDWLAGRPAPRAMPAPRPPAPSPHEPTLSLARLAQLGTLFAGSTAAARQVGGMPSQAISNPLGAARSGFAAVRNAGLAATAFSGPIGLAVAAMGLLGEVAIGAVEKLRSLSKELHDANMAFAEFSGAMARVQVEQFQRDVQLSRQRGDRRAASARVLAQARHASETMFFAPLQDTLARILNINLAMLHHLFLMSNIISMSGLQKLSSLLDKLEELAGLKPPPGALGDQLRAIGQEHYKPWFPDEGRPQRFNP